MHALLRAPKYAEPRDRDAASRDRRHAWPRTARRRRSTARRERRTGFEPFVLAAAVGLAFWTLVLLLMLL